MKWIIVSESLDIFGWKRHLHIANSKEEAEKNAKSLLRFKTYKIIDILTIIDYEKKYKKRIPNKWRDDDVYDWLEKEFYFSNHRKYHKYFYEWINALTNEQIEYFKKMMYSQKNKTKYV